MGGKQLMEAEKYENEKVIVFIIRKDNIISGLEAENQAIEAIKEEKE